MIQLALIVVILHFVVIFKKMKKNILTTYYKNLVAMLRKLNIKANKIFTKEIDLSNTCSNYQGKIDFYINY